MPYHCRYHGRVCARLRARASGAEGTETIDTKKELRYALLSKKDIAVLRMTDRYTEPYAQARMLCSPFFASLVCLCVGGEEAHVIRATFL